MTGKEMIFLNEINQMSLGSTIYSSVHGFVISSARA